MLTTQGMTVVFSESAVAETLQHHYGLMDWAKDRTHWQKSQGTCFLRDSNCQVYYAIFLNIRLLFDIIILKQTIGETSCKG